ncbi:NAD(P)H-dependent glycerol-3-phosphate dehydrogenase [Elioraea thermophila]|uniref:NAD(P)H-dependent glycerol-3-phosphate dehydrogenase n=1 Tax=Elioraea thermophila TaxID=2185104 RepID=UPI000DF1D928|nr:NAD(P)H-dependent glycerol-3-phosphate dehydrogenase [Elioraea thermophila]
MSRLTVLGAGAWGTALAVRLAERNRVTLWARDPTRAKAIASARRNERYLPGISLPEAVVVTADPAEAIAGAEAVLVVIPTQHLRAVAERFAALWPSGMPVVICAKGIEAGTLRLPSEILDAVLPGAPLAVLTGPSFAHEVARGLPAALVLACPDEAVRADLRQRLAIDRIRLYGSPDVIGAQLGGAAKNVIAIAAGVVEGGGFGENARAALITRGLAELARLILAEGGRAETASGLAGLGDLILTCTGAASRNHSLGVALGRGEPLDAILAARRGVTEGVATAPALVARARMRGIELPIAEAVADLLAGRASPSDLAERLLGRPPRDE